MVEYPSFIANLPTLQEPHYVLYTADTDAETQQPWCPDCQQADPIVEEVIKERGGTLLKVKVSFHLLRKLHGTSFHIAKVCVCYPTCQQYVLTSHVHWKLLGRR